MRDVHFGVRFVRFVRSCTLYRFIKILLSEQEELVKKMRKTVGKLFKTVFLDLFVARFVRVARL